MRRSPLFLLFLICALPALSALAAPANTPTPPPPAATTPPGDAVPMRLTAIHKPDLLHVQALTHIARAIEAATNRQIRPELLTSGKKGSEEEALQEQLQGNLEGGFTSAATLARLMPAFRLLTIPLLFSHPDSVRGFIGSPLDTALRQTASGKKLKVLGYASYGFYGILSFRPVEGGSTSRRVDAKPGWENLAVRLPRDAWMTDLHQALALRPVQATHGDLARALSEGWIQGVVSTPEMLNRTALPTTAATYFETRHLHGWSLFTVNQEWFDRLAAPHREAITRAVEGALPQTLEQAFALERKLLDKWTTENRLPVVTPPPRENVNRLRELALKAARETETTLNLPGAVTRLWERNQPDAPRGDPNRIAVPAAGKKTAAPRPTGGEAPANNNTNLRSSP